MWPVIVILLVTASIFFIEVPKLKRDRKKKEIVYVCVLLAAGSAASIMEARGADLPNPADLIQAFYAPINNWLTKTFYS
ncbi:hypothetical protein [Halobacillus massiliensis]|uniref:hypothetical protein n=1 Tax=Halobacillus massiliensis TaxID=1926286 RepID=UPI0009E544DE|nr:hypothetical protein [Halobacillus massiliensis]